MGDVPLGSQPTGRSSNMAHSSRQESSQSPPTALHEDSEGRKGQQGIPSQTSYPHSQPYPQQQYPSQTRAESFNMNALGSALPDLSYQNYGPSLPQRYAASSSGLVYHPQAPQFAGAQNLAPSGNPQYNVPYQGQYQGIYPQGQSPSPPHLHPGVPAASNQFYHNQMFLGQQQQGSPYFVQPSQYSPQNQMYPTLPSPTQYNSRSSFPGDTRFQTQQRANEYLDANYTSGGAGRSSSIGELIPYSSYALTSSRWNK
jgi:hypothetical protein